MRIGIIVNPRARRAQNPSLLPGLDAICRDFPTIHCQLTVTESPAALHQTMAKFADQRIDVLATCGGDGTLTATLTEAARAFGNELPLWLPLAGGTINTVAKNLGANEPPTIRLRRVLSLISANGELPTRNQPTLRIASSDEVPLDFQTVGPQLDAPRTSAVRIGFLASAAMGARFLAAYTASPSRGLWSASLLGLRTIGSSMIPGGGPFARWLFAPLPTQLTVDGIVQSAPSYRLLIASTIPDVGLGMKVPWQAGRHSDRFQLVASSLPVTTNVLQLHRILRGKPMQGQPHLDTLAQKAALVFEQPEPIVLDGELFCAAQLNLSIGPTLRVISPVVAPQGLEPRTLRV